MYVCARTCMCACMGICACVRVCVCAGVCAHACTYGAYVYSMYVCAERRGVEIVSEFVKGVYGYN